MSYMEFLKENFLPDAKDIVVDSGTDLTDYLHDRNYKTSYISDGYNSDTSTILTVEFSTPTVVSHVLLMNNNFKKARLFYNSVTANTFSPDFNTTTSDQTNLYVSFASVTVNSVSIQIDTCFSTTVEKKLGQFVVTERKLQFDQNPEATKYKPAINRKFVLHKMPDGGISQYNIKDKFAAKLGFKSINATFYDNLLDVYEDADELIFVPFPTSTAWDAKAYPVVWTGKFDFAFVANNKATGYKGTIVLAEQTSGG